MPKDVPLGYFYAPNKEGGLGLPCLDTLIPKLTSSPLSRFSDSKYEGAQEALLHRRVQRKIRWAKNALRTHGLEAENPKAEQAKRLWTERLHGSVDGSELRESGNSALSTLWIHRNAHMIPGGEYIKNTHVHINTLPCKMRISRGQRESRKTECRAGCSINETTAHTTQGCWRTHGGRILRHDNISRTIATNLREKGFTVEEEPHFKTANGLRKHDIVAVKDKKAVIIDTEVVPGTSNLTFIHNTKKNKYRLNKEVQKQDADVVNVTIEDITTTSCTISWRGVWARESHDDLNKLGFQNNELAGLTTKAIRGSYLNWVRFNQITSVMKQTKNPSNR